MWQVLNDDKSTVMGLELNLSSHSQHQHHHKQSFYSNLYTQVYFQDSQTFSTI